MAWSCSVGILPRPTWPRSSSRSPCLWIWTFRRRRCSKAPAHCWNRSANANIAKVKRGRFEFDVLDGDRWVTEFHRHMYRPSMRSRHGAEAYVDSRQRTAQLARTAGSELLRVLQDGKWVAGSINRSTPDGYRLAKIGWLEGEEGLLKSGVVSAVYWFSFQRAAVLGYRRILFGQVAPYLEDGLFFTRANGVRGSPPSNGSMGSSVSFSNRHTLCAIDFLKAHSILTRGTDRDFIVFCGRGPEAVDVCQKSCAASSGGTPGATDLCQRRRLPPRKCRTRFGRGSPSENPNSAQPRQRNVRNLPFGSQGMSSTTSTCSRIASPRSRAMLRLHCLDRFTRVVKWERVGASPRFDPSPLERSGSAGDWGSADRAGWQTTADVSAAHQRQRTGPAVARGPY